MSPEALAETLKIVEEELKATGFQVGVKGPKGAAGEIT